MMNNVYMKEALCLYLIKTELVVIPDLIKTKLVVVPDLMNVS